MKVRNILLVMNLSFSCLLKSDLTTHSLFNSDLFHPDNIKNHAPEDSEVSVSLYRLYS